MIGVSTSHILDVAPKRQRSSRYRPSRILSWRNISGETADRVSRMVGCWTGWARKLEGKHWCYWRLGELPVRLGSVFGSWLSCWHRSVIEVWGIPALTVLVVRIFMGARINRSYEGISHESLGSYWRIATNLFVLEIVDSHSLDQKMLRILELVVEVGDSGYNGLLVR